MTDKPETSTDPFAALSNSDVRILAPDFALKKIIGEDVDIRQIFNPETIEKAQIAINEHKDAFLEWVKKDIEQIHEHYRLAALDPAANESEIRKLAKTAFIIKSQAGTFGFGLATRIAKSLDDFCNHDYRPVPEHMMVIKKHIETLFAVFHKHIDGEGGELGKQLSENLTKLVSKYRSAGA